MYNRYIPQPDGSFQRNRMPEPETPKRPAPPQAQWKPEPTPEPNCPPENREPPHGNPGRPPRRPNSPPKQPPRPSSPPRQGTGIFQFFRQFLPRDFDTEDLLIVLLLLLMAGDCKEDQNTALLTLALYLFM